MYYNYREDVFCMYNLKWLVCMCNIAQFAYNILLPFCLYDAVIFVL